MSGMVGRGVAVPLVVAWALLSGCGEDGGGRTRAAFVEDANALCATLIETRTSLAEKHFPSQTSPPTVEQLQAFYAEMGPVFTEFVEAFAALEPAGQDEGLFGELVGEGRRVAATINEAAADASTARRLLETDEAEFHKADALVEELGVNRDC